MPHWNVHQETPTSKDLRSSSARSEGVPGELLSSSLSPGSSFNMSRCLYGARSWKWHWEWFKYFFWNPYERERDIYIFITPSWWSHQRPTPKHLPRCLHLWAAAAMVARHLRGEHDSDSSPPTCIYIYKIACDAVSPGSHFQRSFPGTVAKVVTAILRLKTHVLSKPRIQIDPFTNFYWNFKVKSNLLIILFLGGLCLASLLDPGTLCRSHLRLRLGLRHRSTLRRCLWRCFRRHDRLDVPAEPREWVSWNLKESGAHEYVTPCIV